MGHAGYRHVQHSSCRCGCSASSSGALTKLLQFHHASRLAFFGSIAPLADRRAFVRYLSPVRKKRWVVYGRSRRGASGSVPCGRAMEDVSIPYNNADENGQAPAQSRWKKRQRRKLANGRLPGRAFRRLSIFYAPSPIREATGSFLR
jgi:hypothetical protein